ncbi:hypothetical protein ACVGVM_19295 [Pseudonocardia bannensis]|nr:hypothetical protein [Pseudonocardia bannensis]
MEQLLDKPITDTSYASRRGAPAATHLQLAEVELKIAVPNC